MKKVSLILNALTIAAVIYFAMQNDQQSIENIQLNVKNELLTEQAARARQEAEMNEAEAIREKLRAEEAAAEAIRQYTEAQEALKNCQKKK